MLVSPQDLEWPKDVHGFGLIVLIGVFGFCAQTLLTFGLQNEKAGRAGLAMYLQVS
jgi:drug/metabolite transporter (DMT)-like permease